jgi:hypothetical protein
MKLTKNVITEADATKIAPDYVKFIKGDWDALTAVLKAFERIRRNQKAITYVDGQYVQVKVTSVNSNDWRAIDGPIVRVGNGEYTWRVDGDRYCWPV